MNKKIWCATAVLALALSACSSGGSGGDDEAEVKVDAAKTVGMELADFKWQTDGVDRDATIKIGDTLQMSSADAHAAGTTVSTQYFNLTYDRLFWVDANSTLRGYLVKDWKFVDGGLQLNLRDDATFNDNSVLDAEAVKVNIDRARTAEFSAYQAQLSTIEDVEVVDEFSLLLKTKPNAGATLPYVLGGWAGMIMNPKFLGDPELLRTTAPKGIGSGPYEVTSWTPGEDTVVLERVRDHWDPAAGQVARIEIKANPDQVQLVNAVSTGEFDLTRSSQGLNDVLAKAKGNPKLQSGEFVGTNSVTALFMRDLVDPTVREAVSLAIDRDALVDVYEGSAAPTNQFFPEGRPAHTDEIDEFTTMDPAAAAELVKKAPAGKTSLTMAYVEDGTQARLAQLIQAELKAVGIDVKLLAMTHASIYQAWFKGQFEMVLMGTAGPSHASTGIDAALLRAGTSWGAPDSALEGITAELAKADDPALSEDDRNKIYQAIFVNTAKEHWVLPFAQLRNLTFGSSKLVNVQPGLPWQYSSLADFRYVAVKAG